MKLSEYIVMLQEFALNNPDLEVCMTEAGYYADSPFADLYDKPEIKECDVSTEYKVRTMQPFIVLGHSYQSY